MSDRDFRLSKNVRPVRYAIEIDADLDAWKFRGSETIELTIAEPTDVIVLHAVDLALTRVEARVHVGTTLAGRPEFNAEAETATLRFERRLPAGAATLAIDFHGEIRAALRGFYRSQKDGARYAATQFEAADARRAFPCFDEPEFKARFGLTLVGPKDLTFIANGPVLAEEPVGKDRKRVRFAETPPISSYLVAYTMGPYEATPVATTPTGIPVRVFLPRGMADKGLFARDAHARSVVHLEEYTAIAHPYAKVDAIGVPDFEAGAMENPGAITYRLTAIAADEASASTNALKGIFYTAAHELTHMWWGDLVTMAWWDDLWLNESFATFVGYKVTAELMPEWGMWRDFVGTLTRPFNLDALVSTHPISFEVKNARQAAERFDVITYWKGAGVVRMIERFLGETEFRDGVRAYLNRYREGNATADDFWRELGNASGRDVAVIANAWIRQPGHPLVTASAVRAGDHLNVQLRQERFLADPSAPREHDGPTWPIPLVIKYGTDAGVHEERFLLDRREASVELRHARWFFPNGDGAGFYRVAMDDASLAALVEASAANLNPQERLTLVGNQWALAKAGKVPIAQFFAMLRGFRNEPDRAVLSAITERLAWLATHAVEEASEAEFHRFVLDLYHPLLEQVGWEPAPGESADERMRRATIVAGMGDVGRDVTAMAVARKRLDAYLLDRSRLDPNLVSVVLAVCARSGDEALFETYLDRKRTAAKDPEEEQRFLFGLTAFEAPDLVRRGLDLCLSDEVRPQDSAHFLAAWLGNRAARGAAWEFVRSRWDELTARMDPMLQQNLVRGLALLTPEPLAAQVGAFLPPRAVEETRETVAQAIEQLTIDAKVCARLRADLAKLDF